METRLITYSDSWELYINNQIELTNTLYKDISNLYEEVLYSTDFEYKDVLVINGGNQILSNLIKNNTNIVIIDSLGNEYTQYKDILNIDNSITLYTSIEEFISLNRTKFDLIVIDISFSVDYNKIYNKEFLKVLKAYSRNKNYICYIPINKEKEYLELISKLSLCVFRRVTSYISNENIEQKDLYVYST